MSRKVKAILVAVVMVVAGIPLVPSVVRANDAVPYINADGDLVSPGITDYTVVTASDESWGTVDNTTWYVVKPEAATTITNPNRITVNGTVNLILCDGATLTATKGISVKFGNTLRIYAQTAGTGKLYAGSATNGVDENNAGIGGSYGGQAADRKAGTIIINGGNVTAIGGNKGAGIGGSFNGDGDRITINGGCVTANGGDGAEGIGKGNGGSSSTLTIGSGVTVYGKDNDNSHAYSKLGDAQSQVTTRKRFMQAVSGSIPYQKWDPQSESIVPADPSCSDFILVTRASTVLDGSSDGIPHWYVVNTDVTIDSRITVNGTVNLILCDGKTLTASEGITVSGDNTLNIYGQTAGTGTLLSGTDGENTTCDSNYSGIGGGDQGSGGTIAIYGGNVTATGGESGAGIGGGKDGNPGYVTIYGGTVTATGGNSATGIGSGNNSNGHATLSEGVITINGGVITAKGGAFAAGIGGGYQSNSCDVIINGGTVESQGGAGAAGIGAGNSAHYGEVIVNGGNVTATGGGLGNNELGAGICGGVDEQIDKPALTVSGNPKITAIGGTYNGESVSSTVTGGNGITGGVLVTGGLPEITATGGKGAGGSETGAHAGFGIEVSSVEVYGVAVKVTGGSPTITATGGEPDNGAAAGAGIMASANKTAVDISGATPTIYAFSGGTGTNAIYGSGNIPSTFDIKKGNTKEGSWEEDVEYGAEGVDAQFVKISPKPVPPTPPTPGPSPDPTPKPEPEPEPEIPTIDPGTDPTAGEKIDESTKQEITNETPTGGSETTTTYKTEDGKDVTVVETKEQDGSTSKTTTVESDTEKKEQTTSIDANGNKTESARQEDKITGDFVESTKVTNADGTTEEQSASKTTDPTTKAVTETQDTKATDGSTTAYDKTTQTNDDFVENFVAKDAEGNVTEQRSASRETAEDGTVTEKSASSDANGTSESEKVTKADGTGDFTESSVTKDAAGNVLESKEASQVTDAETGDVTEKALTKDVNGSMESEKTTKGDGTGDFTESSVTKDAEGNVLESKEASQVTDAETGDVTEKALTKDVNGSMESEKTTKGDGSGDYTEKSETKDANGNVVESKEASQTTDANNVVTNEEKTIKDDMTTVKKDVQAPDGSGSVLMSVEDANGKTSNEVTKGKGGGVAGIRQEDAPVNGEPVVADYAVDGDNVTLSNVDTNASEVAIGDTLPAADGNTYKVTEVGQGAFKGNTNLTAAAFGAGIRKLAEQAMRGCKQLVALIFGVSDLKKNTTSVKGLTGASSKIVLEKNCLKGTSKKLIIGVETKADKKAVKKQLKKAGNKKAKVKIGYRLK